MPKGRDSTLLIGEIIEAGVVLICHHSYRKTSSGRTRTAP